MHTYLHIHIEISIYTPTRDGDRKKRRIATTFLRVRLRTN